MILSFVSLGPRWTKAQKSCQRIVPQEKGHMTGSDR